MAIITTHTCDRCGHSQTADLQYKSRGEQDQSGYRHMRSILIAVSENHNYPNIHSCWERSALWCAKCIPATGLDFTPIKRSEPARVEPSFEDILRAIIREEIEK